MLKSTQTKTNILTAATDLFYENGYEMTSTKTIAERAKVSEALIFKYFKNKQNLVTAVLNETLESFKRISIIELDEILKLNHSAKDKLEEFFQNRVRFIELHYKAISIIIRKMQFDPSIQNTVKSLIVEKIDPTIKKMLITYFESEQLSKDNLDIGVSLIKNIIYETMIDKVIFDQPCDLDLINQKLQIIMKGLEHA